MIRRPPRSTLSSSSAASDVYKRQYQRRVRGNQLSMEPPASNPNGAITAPGDLPLESWWVLGDLYQFTQRDDKSFTMEVVAYPCQGGHPPNHVHANEDEHFYLIDGSMMFMVNDAEPTECKPGTYLWQPRGTKHTFWPAGDAPSRFSITISPPGIENMFRAIGTDAGEVRMGEIPEVNVPPTEEQLETLAKLSPEYGVTLFPPGE
eukprot:TRINITY_DN27537_c0_g1_i1.p1 TRINITY_DN27537_c0_g1~~TRINITY_DN27537_c0_g1_i1.p1  ORF type:complete len:205 (+),score=60.91 TRINITY_DN27537_c0_g1_i1:116-730(+)